MKYFIQIILLLVIFPNLTFAQLTYVPDDTFEQNLIDLGLDSGPLDDYVQTSAIDTLKMLSVHEVTNINITDPLLSLEGIEAFTSLNRFQISGCNYIFNDTIDLSLLTNLDTIVVDNISFGTYKNVIYPPNLNVLQLFGVSSFENNHLNLNGVPNLEFIEIESPSYLYSIDFSNNSNLKSVIIENSFTSLEHLDLSFCPLLENLNLTSSDISYINLKNGNNDNLNFQYDFSQPVTVCVDNEYSQLSLGLLTYSLNTQVSVTISEACTTNLITGQLKYDINSDNCSTSSVYLNSFLVNSSDGINSMSSSLALSNYYSNYVFEGNYETTILGLPSYLSASPLSETTIFVGEYNIDTINFCITPTQQINDLSVYFTSLNTSAPGFDATGTLIFKNEGTTTLSGDVSLTYNDTYLDFLNSSETVSSQSNNQLTFSYSNLQPFETRGIEVNFNIHPSPNTQIGDTLSFVAEITPLINDYNDTNNLFSVDQIVNGSYDPNDISVREGAEVEIEKADEYLHYLIRFQNTGTAPAVNVNVQTELDSNLNWNSLRLINSSHPTVIDMYNDNLEFKFSNINLPDSLSNESGSHGYVYYKIKPKDGVVVGDNISATANIYFDYNPPVVTNTAVTLFVEDPLGLIETSVNSINIYPVPVNDILNVDSENLVLSIEIYNQLGQLIVSVNNTNMLNLSNIENGFYICKVIDNQGHTFVKSIIKE